MVTTTEVVCCNEYHCIVCQTIGHANKAVCSRPSGDVDLKSSFLSTEANSGFIQVNSGTSESNLASIMHLLSSASEVAATLIFTDKSTQLNATQGKQVNE